MALPFCYQFPDMNTSSGAIFFHTPFRADLFERRFPRRFKAAPLLFRFHGDATALPPPGIKLHIAGLIRITCSMPEGTFGGW